MKKRERELQPKKLLGGIKKPSYLPSYMVVDTSGGILPCDNNWQEVEYRQHL